MKIFNVIWLDNHLEPTVQSFYTFEDALKSVKSDLCNYERQYSCGLDIDDTQKNYYFARIEDVIEVEIIATEVQ